MSGRLMLCGLSIADPLLGSVVLSMTADVLRSPGQLSELKRRPFVPDV